MMDVQEPRVTVRFFRFTLLAAVAATIALAGCTSTATSPTPVVTYSQADLRIGTGTEAASGKTITVNYTGWLYDATKADKKGLQVDSSIGRTPFQFVLGSAQVIPGWDQGIPGMKVGGVRQLVIPPSLAYGDIRNGPIPANVALVFDIELLDVQ